MDVNAHANLVENHGFALGFYTKNVIKKPQTLKHKKNLHVAFWCKTKSDMSQYQR